DFAVDHEGDQLVVVGDRELRRPGRVGDGALRVGLVVGVRLDGELARLARFGGHDPQVRPALVDDPFAGGVDARPADARLLVVGQGDRLAGGDRPGLRRRQLLLDDVGGAAGAAAAFANEVEVTAVGGPHRRVVLAVEGGDAAVVAAVEVADPDVVVGRAAVAL